MTWAGFWEGHGFSRAASRLKSFAALAAEVTADRIIFVAMPPLIKTVNLKSDKPSVHESLQRLERELCTARQENLPLLKIIHGYGSTRAGGDIRIAVQRRLQELAEAGQIRACIFGENWSRSDETTWHLLRHHAALKNDADLGRRNRGITIVVL